jgi:hypothetical protein
MPEFDNSRISVEELRRRVNYDPETGEFTYLVACGTRLQGRRADRVKLHGYRSLYIRQKEILAHRAAWALFYGDWPDSRLDHVSLDKTDNRIANLRLATAMQNRANTPVHKSNLLGVKGVSQTPKGRFRAVIKVNEKSRYLGTFDTAEEAQRAYENAAQESFGIYARSDKKSCVGPST